MQLVAYGAQDVYLTGNPQITFFKVVYRRHTNFAVEAIAIPLSGAINFGSKATVTIQRNGDLMLQTYLRVVMKEVKDDQYTGRFAWVRRLGHALIEDVSLLIGGSQIDKHYGTWMDIWYELTHDINQERGYAQMIGDTPEITELSSANENGLIKPRFEMFIPLQFWFCRNPGLALPLIALQYHEVRMDFTIANKDRLFIASDGNYYYEDGQSIIDNKSIFKTSDAYRSLGIDTAEVLVNYVYLDSEERRRFAQVGHEYLIEQLQFTGAQTINGVAASNRTQGQYDLNFNHPSKELVWALKSGSFTTGERFLAYSSGLTPNAWNDALADAAGNIARGMVIVSTEEIDNPDYEELDAMFGSAPTSFPTPSQSQPHTLDYNILLIGVSDKNSLQEEENDQSVSPEIKTDFHVYIIKDVLKCEHPSYNLGDKIEHIDIHINYTKGTDETQGDTYELDEVICLKHSLTMRDLSLPIRFFPIDKRVNKEDVVVYQHHNYGLLMDGSVNPVDNGKIQLNGMDRFSTRTGKYFNYVQPHEHHTRTPADGINVYSFALKPEEHQPSGSANLSRIDKTTLNIAFNDPTYLNDRMIPLGAFGNTSNLFIFDFNYNVLRIMSGMGGIAYSN